MSDLEAENESLRARIERNTRFHQESETAMSEQLQGAVEALRDLIGNAPCYCDHPLRAGMGPCSKCRAQTTLNRLEGQ